MVRRYPDRVAQPPIKKALCFCLIPGNKAMPEVNPPTIPPRWPAKSILESKLIKIEITVKTPIMQQSWDLSCPADPNVVQLITKYAMSPPNTPNITVDAPTLILEGFKKTADVMLPE